MDWIFDALEENAADDIYAARSWLLVTKCIFPKNFRVLFEAYKLEKMEKNLTQCAVLLSEMFTDFPDEYLLNKELDLVVMTQSPDKDEQELLTSIFDALSLDMQQKMLIYVAQKQTDMNLVCKLTINAIQKLPKDTMKYGLPLIERLINDEKDEFPSSPLNKYRKILICDVLPAICDSPAIGELSPKQFYKWLQKAVEFFVAYNTTSHNVLAEAIGKVDMQWSDLELIRSKIGRQCGWELFPHGSNTLTDRMKFIKEMCRLSRTDLSGNINKKQIFYSSILLLLESSIELNKFLDPAFFNPGSNGSSAYTICLQPCISNSGKSDSCLPALLKESVRDCFDVARTAWQILHSNESYSKDFSHLVKRWKMDRWVWLQLFLALHHVLEKDYNGCILRLTRLLEQNWNDQYHLVSVRCLSLLASVHYVSDQRALACKCIIDCVAKMAMTLTPHSVKKSKIETTFFSDGPDSNSSLILMQVNITHFLPYWIHAIISSLSGTIRSQSCTDETLGHLIVLSQQDWPKWKELCGSVLDVISHKSNFNYPIFFDYVVIADILEEISLLRNTSSNKSITLLNGNFANQQRVTRGVNKGNEEEFNNAITIQMNKGEEQLEDILADFLLKQEKSILDSVFIAEESMEH